MLDWRGPEALEEYRDERGNHVVRLLLAPSEGIRIDWRVTARSIEFDRSGELGAAPAPTAVDAPLCGVTPEIAAVAHRVSAGAGTGPEEDARRFFWFAQERLKYRHPPVERGAQAALERAEGDCGEFAWLFVALCTAVGIPARPVLGVLLPDWAAITPHAWAEVHLPRHGWIPVDPSMAQQVDRVARLYGVPHTPAFYFGNLDPYRLVLSRGTGHRWPGCFEPVLHRDRRLSLRLDGVDVCWGQELLRGRIPYLQPAYVRVVEAPRRVTEQALLGSFGELHVHRDDRSSFWRWLWRRRP